MALSFLQTATSTADASSYTFSSQNLGTAAADRYIIVTIFTRDSGESAKSISSVTVGGVSASIVIQRQNAVTNSNIVGLAIAAVPTGTTGDVVVNFSEAMLRCGIGLYRATELASATATDTGSSTASAPTYDIDVVAGGFAIGVSASSEGSPATWSGITEDYDTTVETFLGLSGASATFETQQTNLTLTCTWTGGINNQPVGVFASWEKSSATSVKDVIGGMGIIPFAR